MGVLMMRWRCDRVSKFGKADEADVGASGAPVGGAGQVGSCVTDAPYSQVVAKENTWLRTLCTLHGWRLKINRCISSTSYEYKIKAISEHLAKNAVEKEAREVIDA
ncbi:hypothetical protein [Rhodoblastus acidophilus]|nr:hypothetical protein [Rhodoblastus acidophilus]